MNPGFYAIFVFASALLTGLTGAAEKRTMFTVYLIQTVILFALFVYKAWKWEKK